MTRKTFNEHMALLAATWPERAPSKETLAAYWLALADLDDSTFQVVIAHCVRECTFYPKPVEIRRAAEAALIAHGQLPPDGETAWASVLAARRDYDTDNGWVGVVPGYEHLGRLSGGYVPCPLRPAIYEAVRAVGGMERICCTKNDGLGYLRREFLEEYQPIRARLLRDGHLLGQALTEPTPALVRPVEVGG